MHGKRLRELRQKRGYSQESLAEALGVGNRQIWRYENEETDPDGAVVAKIARILGTSADYLLGLTDDPIPYIRSKGELSDREYAIILALRLGDPLEAIRMITSGE